MTNTPRPASPNRRKRQRGQALVEGALISLGFLSSLILVVELSRYVLFIQFFTERARAGARYSAVSNYNTDTVKNWIVYNSPTAPTSNGQGTSTVSGLFGLTPSMVTVNRYNQSTDIDRLEIAINNYPVSLVVPMLPAQWTLKPFRVVLTAESMGATN